MTQTEVCLRGMGRIEHGYELKFRALLGRTNASKIDLRVKRFLQRAQRLTAQEGISSSQALARVFHTLLVLIARWNAGKDQPTLNPPCSPPEFLCDAGLGGLARWLRAAGYEARWTRDIGDDELIQQAQRQSAILITTDSLMMERRLLRDGVIPAIWVPPSLRIAEQLRLVLGELHLPFREARCMECGGELQKVDKQQWREKIPPRTYRWLEEYFVCRRCGKLFWRGTHWERIQRALKTLQTLPRL